MRATLTGPGWTASFDGERWTSSSEARQQLLNVVFSPEKHPGWRPSDPAPACVMEAAKYLVAKIEAASSEPEAEKVH